jgi:hypothetical protein
MLPVGINVMSQLQTHWFTGANCEYEVTMSTSGTRTVYVPGISDVFWDNFVGNYSSWPIYTAYGAYNALYAIKATLENINATDLAAVKSYLDTTGGSSDVLIPYFEKTHVTLSTGKFQFTSGIYGPGTGHDVFAIEFNLTNLLGYPRGLMVQWINGSKASPPVSGGVLTVVSPRDQDYSKKTLIPPWMYELADVDIDFTGGVDIRDIARAAKAFGSAPGKLRWDLEADVNIDGKIDIRDIALIAKNFGKSVSPWPLP